jgi:hypothetical protein
MFISPFMAIASELIQIIVAAIYGSPKGLLALEI